MVPEYMTDGGLWRFDPKNWKLERFMQVDVSNPWGVTIDDYGQTFLSDASGGANWWSLPLSAKVPHGQEIEKLAQFTTHRVAQLREPNSFLRDTFLKTLREIF